MDSLTYIGHATTLLRLGSASILTDPLLRGGIGPLRRQGPAPQPGLAPDVVLISHLHRDHLDLRSLRRLPPGSTLVVPRGAAPHVRRSGAANVIELGRGESTDRGDFEITAVRADHDGHRDRWGEAVEALGYLVRGGGKTVYFAGDTDLFPEMSEFGPVDLALLPIWGWGPSLGGGHLNPERAARAAALVRARVAVPIHWGSIYPAGLRRLLPRPLSEPPLRFSRFAAEYAPEVEVRVVAPGEETAL
jgi:L-ascorbate metabolism protein UlaG (beta-lactamase superfamily)